VKWNAVGVSKSGRDDGIKVAESKVHEKSDCEKNEKRRGKRE